MAASGQAVSKQERIEHLKRIADEKCRTYRESYGYWKSDVPNFDSFIHSKEECKAASRAVISALEEIISEPTSPNVCGL